MTYRVLFLQSLIRKTNKVNDNIHSREIMIKIKTFLKKEQLWEQAIHLDAIVGNALINFKIGYHVSF